MGSSGFCASVRLTSYPSVRVPCLGNCCAWWLHDLTKSCRWCVPGTKGVRELEERSGGPDNRPDVSFAAQEFALNVRRAGQAARGVGAAF